MSRPLRVALLGSRGIPANYGGYETLMEEVATRLAAGAWSSTASPTSAEGSTVDAERFTDVERLTDAELEVTVYCRAHHTPKALRDYRGVRLVVLPTLRTKFFDTPVHTFLSCLHAALRGRFDAALVVNSANAVFVPILRLGGIPTALHVDGIEKKRAKWGPFGRAVYALSERLACVVPSVLVTDAEVIRDHYRRRYGADSWMITYGVDPVPPSETGVLERLGLEPRRYFLYVSRFEPENNPHRVVEAYREVGGDLPLVMVGSAPYAGDFIEAFKRRADARVLFPGGIYGDGYRELLSGALAYIHATEVGGTHPALVEAMGYGNCIVVNDTPENVEVAGEVGFPFQAPEPASLAAVLDRIRENPGLARQRGDAAARRAQERFSWPSVTARYAELLTTMATG
ncbi:MAG: glycosyltransferase [Acidobacteriota bacterium]